jgi:CBS domain-containing protein
LRGIRVDSVMERDLPAVSPQLTLDTFAAQYLASNEGTSLPVMRDQTLLGLIGISQLRRIRQSSWPSMRASDVMVSPPLLPTLEPDDELWPALERLRRAGLDGLPVLHGDELLGVLTRRGVVHAIQQRTRPAIGVAP